MSNTISKKVHEFAAKHGHLIARKQKKLFDFFIESLKNPAKAQQDFLLRVLKRNQDTDFGREHHFAEIATTSDFQHNVPTGDYETFRPYIEQVIAGNSSALLTQKPKLFLRTSGTTDKPKFIPVTKESGKDIKKGYSIWLQALFKDHPKIPAGKTLPITSPAKEGKIKRYNYSSYSGRLRSSQPAIVRFFYAVPPKLFQIEDESIRYYALIRTALEKNVTMLNTANPSTILKLIQTADDKKQALIRDIRDGTLTCQPDKYDKKITRRLRFKPNPDRAKELEKIVQNTGHLFPRDYWKNLELIGCWKGGSQSIFYSKFNRYFNGISVRDLGILASEGRINIPLTDEGSSGPLAINNGFFEFIPEQEIESSQPITLTTAQLEQDQNYFILLTTSGGLYRYNIGDRIKVTGFRDNTPEITFLDRGEYCSSITGEKLTEYQVVTAMKNLEKGLTKFTIHPVYPVTTDQPYYELLIEESDTEQLNLPRLERDYDKALRRINLEYDSKRKSRLGSVKVRIIEDGSFDKTEKEKLTNGGKKDGSQYKHRFLYTQTPKI